MLLTSSNHTETLLTQAGTTHTHATQRHTQAHQCALTHAHTLDDLKEGLL